MKERLTKSGPFIRKTLAKNKEVALCSIQMMGQSHSYFLERDGLEPAVDLSPANALLVAKAILKDLATRPWSPEGAEAATILGLFMSPKKAVR